MAIQGYSRIVPNSGQTTPSGVAIFGYKPAGVLVSEAGVPASPLLSNGRIYAEVNGPLDTALAIANPHNVSAIVTFSSTNAAGTDSAEGTLTIPANQQIAQFLDQSPINIASGFQGTFTFSSNVPVSVIALQTFNNERVPSEQLITTLPVIDTSIATGTAAVVLPYFADGGDGITARWTTAILLVNPGDTTLTGTIQFRDGTTGAPATLSANGQAGSSFNYTVNRRSSFKLLTSGAGVVAGVPATGSVTVTPAAGSSTPAPLVVFTDKPTAFTVAQAGAGANSGTAFRMYAEASGPFAQPGSISTGIAVANASPIDGMITFDLYDSTGASIGSSQTARITGSGLYVNFINQIFPTLTVPFKGVLRISTSTSAISVVSLRGRWNERDDFLITTTPPTNEGSTASTAEFDFPQIVNGGGYTTQFVLFSGVAGQSSTGNLLFLAANGTTLTLTGVSNSAPAPTLTPISPSSAILGGTVILTGTGFSSTASSDTVVFTTASGTVSTTPSAATATSLTVTVPSTTITGPVTVQVGGVSSASVVLQILASATALLPPTTMNVAVGTTTTGVDIYVPPPAAGLTLVGVGVGDLGTSISYGSSSISVSRGTTKQLLLNGTGLNAGTTVSTSGSGVTLTNAVFQNGFIFVTIAVDPGAATGARNVIVTNSNLDTSMMSGGMFIQ